MGAELATAEQLDVFSRNRRLEFSFARVPCSALVALRCVLWGASARFFLCPRAAVSAWPDHCSLLAAVPLLLPLAAFPLSAVRCSSSALPQIPTTPRSSRRTLTALSSTRLQRSFLPADRQQRSPRISSHLAAMSHGGLDDDGQYGDDDQQQQQQHDQQQQWEDGEDQQQQQFDGDGGDAGGGGDGGQPPNNDGHNDDDEEDEPVPAFLPADHRLMAPVQAALRKELAQRDERVSLALRERETQLLAVKKQRELLGVELYSTQQGLAKLQLELEKRHERYEAAARNRAKNEAQLKEALEKYQTTCAVRDELEKKRSGGKHTSEHARVRGSKRRVDRRTLVSLDSHLLLCARSSLVSQSPRSEGVRFLECDRESNRLME